MAKTSKKALGAAMAGVMAVGAVAGAVNAVDQVKVANAAESQASKDAKAKISHLIYSINNNYAGIKNQAQWEAYAKQAYALIAKMPTAEAAQAAELNAKVDAISDTVLAIARINQVEKSYATNHQGIKNASQWREYLDLAKEDMKSVDQSVFAAKYEELVKRFNEASDNVKKIEDAYAVELAAAEKLYDAAKASMNLDDANKALAAAEALGTHATSDALEAKVKGLIAQIEGVKVEVNTISIDEKTFDDNTKGQRLSIKVNGEAMSIDFLVAAGYSLEFNATKDSDGSAANTAVFGTLLNAVSTNGKLADTVAEDKYKVQVTAKKDGNIIVSDKAAIEVKNIDSTASSISSYKLLNGTKNQVSDKLVVGETVTLSDVKVTNGTTETAITGAKLTSSNDAIISVDNGAGTFKANSLGTAKITVTYGKVSKEFTYTVVAQERKIVSVTPATSSIKAIAGGKTATVKVKAVDQYGDPVAPAYAATATNATDVQVVEPATTDIVNGVAVAAADAKGESVVTITSGTKKGSDTIFFKDKDGKILGRVGVSTTDVEGVSTSKIELVKVDSDEDYSEDFKIFNTVAGTKDSVVKVALNNYTSEGVKLPAEVLTTATIDKHADVDVALVDGDKAVEISADGAKPGNYDVVIKLASGKTYRTTVTVVEPSVTTITGVTFTSFAPLVGDAISASNVLKLDKSSAGDAEVKSLTLSASTPHKVRLNSDGEIYIDKNDNGSYLLADDGAVIGKVVVTGTDSFSTLTVADFVAGTTKLTATDKGNVIISVNGDLNKNGTIDNTEMISSTTISVK
ncbi:hypothetical protein [Clostridium cylindrosporum]|uniref:S-layer protein n=1 Tax=Clostridium cylindrosporum DSM 605 TaxID=1121307 RepID=A0A0J8DAM3_CLOCY|nr:hypothetical protein [Clostridium cylindrosporum]KMT22897.1 S-layer protein [Clostridium cylindrosporum DSM 605]